MESVMNENYGMDEKAHLKDSEAANVEMSELDDSRAKFIKKDPMTDPAEVNVQVVGTGKDKEFTGLTKEELMEYVNSAFWTRMRLALFILFWVGWIAMLAAAIIIIVLAPRCPYRPDHKWWQKEVMYQCYPKSFQDSTQNKGEKMNDRFDDGVGDLKGFSKRIDYLNGHHMKVVWMNSIYDFVGEGIVNHTKISPKYGTIAELRKILKTMHKKGMKMVVDFIPNHTSRNHTWFDLSRKKVGKYTNYYVWKSCSDDTINAPSNWRSVYGGGAWTKDPERNECYYHAFLSGQPDLNLRNDDVKEELKAVLEYWLDVGVDGFHVADAAYLVECRTLSDEKKDTAANVTDTAVDYDYLLHNLTTHLPENAALLQEWNAIVDGFSKPGREKLLFASVAGDINVTLPYFGTGDKPGAHFMPSQSLYNLPDNCDAACFKDRLMSVVDDHPANVSGGWQLGDENNNRFASNGGVKVKGVHALQLLLPGTAVNYYGDEIGLKNEDIAFKYVKDPVGLKAGKDKYMSVYRDKYRTPMRWDGGDKAGFTKGTPWLPMDDLDQPTVEKHAALFSTASLKFFKKLAELRKEPSFRWGKTHWSVSDSNLLSFVRVAEGFPGYLVAINFGTEEVHPKFSDKPANVFPDKMEVVLHSERAIDGGEVFNPHKTAVSVKVGEAIVFKFMKEE